MNLVEFNVTLKMGGSDIIFLIKFFNLKNLQNKKGCVDFLYICTVHLETPNNQRGEMQMNN